MDEIVELENQRTGLTRKFPRAIFDSLVSLCLGLLPKEERERAEEQVGRMVGEFIDTGRDAEPLRMAAEALYPELKGEIRFNTLDAEIIALKIKAWANDVFARYGHPVWLVGSCLNGIGRDVDIRVILPDHEYAARFQDHGAYGLEVGKQGRVASLFLRMNVDFQIQKASDFLVHEGKPRRRLDECKFPEGYEPPKAEMM